MRKSGVTQRPKAADAKRFTGTKSKAPSKATKLVLLSGMASAGSGSVWRFTSTST
jgi:hypothetical protein